MKHSNTNGEYQCCGSGMFIPDPGSDFFPSRIPDPTCRHPESASKNLSILTPQKTKKWFLSSSKYDPGCSSRIRMLTFYPSRIPDPGVKKAPDPGSRGQKGTGSWIRIRNTGEYSIKTYAINCLQSYFSNFCTAIKTYIVEASFRCSE